MKLLPFLSLILVTATPSFAAALSPSAILTQSLSNVRVALSADSASMSFNLDSDQVAQSIGDEAIPQNDLRVSLSGKFTTLQRAKLTNDLQPGLVAWLRCTSDPCSSAEIRLEKSTSGGTKATAFLRYQIMTDVAYVVSGNFSPSGADSQLGTAYSALMDSDISWKSFSTVEVQGGDRFFQFNLGNYPRPMGVAFYGAVCENCDLGVNMTYFLNAANETVEGYTPATIQLTKNLRAARILITHADGSVASLIVGPAGTDVVKLFASKAVNMDDEAPAVH